MLDGPLTGGGRQLASAGAAQATKHQASASTEEVERRPRANAVLLVALGVIAVTGWRLLWFLTDDAFIAFRYIANHRAGLGWVWNPPPFAPVEGYSSFAWLVILDWIWAVLGVPPPDSATFVSLLCALASVALTVAMATRAVRGTHLAAAHLALAAAVGLGVVTNLTFLTWASSGLETAFFNMTVLLWLEAWSRRRSGDTMALAQAAAAAALAALVRPDGLLLAVSTPLWLVGAVEGRRWRRQLIAMLPLLAIPVHFVWRHATYGAWLPNSFYAKVTGRAAWPGGLRYLASFILEYGLWFLLAVVVTTVWRRRQALTSSAGASWVIIPASVLLGHLIFYVVVAGGDFFEYRVLSLWIPLLFLALLGSLILLGTRPRRAVVTVALATLLAIPIPWLHWFYARRVSIWAGMTLPLTPRLSAMASWLPRLVWSYVAAWDDLQAWLVGHYIGIRREEQRQLVVDQLGTSTLPPNVILRRRGDFLPVATVGAVGVPGWRLPNLAIIDSLGINDYVVARNPRLRGPLLGHGRQPPEGYLECFGADIRQHPVWVSDQRIRFCESWYRALLRNHQPLTAPPANLLPR